MYLIAHYVLLVLYGILPVALPAWAARRRRAGQRGWAVSVVFAWTVGGLVGVGVVLLNRWLLGGRVHWIEWIRTIYFAIAAACMLVLVDRLSKHILFLVMRVRTDRHGGVAVHGPRSLLTLLLQRGFMFLAIVAYTFALLIAYRPRVTLAGDPASLKLAHAQADFRSLDGTPIAGWWIAAARPPESSPSQDSLRRTAQWGRHTVVLCHGVGSGKERLLELASMLSRNGFNVLVFDFRAHGESGGNFITYGDRERLDVLAALFWIRSNHAAESQRIYGMGLNTGAAALLAAAVDERGGVALDAVVLCEPYADFAQLASNSARRVLPRPFNILIERVSIPLASLHSGSNLRGLAPASMIEHLWPRPVLVVHAQGPSFVPPLQGMDLYQRAGQPKRQFWPDDTFADEKRRMRESREDLSFLADIFRRFMGITPSVTDDAGVRSKLLDFLDNAEEVPVL